MPFSSTVRALLGRARIPLVALLVVAGLAVGAGSASAAAPVTLAPGANTWFPTWLGRTTHVCAHGAYGRVTVSPFPYWTADVIYTNPFTDTCDVKNWAGNVVMVTNPGPGSEIVSSY